VKIAPDAMVRRSTFRRPVKPWSVLSSRRRALIRCICGLLLIALRRVRDVAITMAPIVLTGFLTLGSCVLIGSRLNFANIIALPLLFGIGVAFHIYFVMSWRSAARIF